MTDATDTNELDEAEAFTDSEGGEGLGCVRSRPSPPSGATNGPVRFSLNRDTVLDAHRFFPTAFERPDLGYGAGGSLLDFDEDGLIDVFLASPSDRGTPPCLYRNVSSDSETRFEKFRCWPELGSVIGARRMDHDGDGVLDLIGYGSDRIVRLATDQSPMADRDIFHIRDATNRPCLVYSVAPVLARESSLLVFFGEAGFELTDGLAISPHSLCRPMIVSDPFEEYPTVTLPPGLDVAVRTLATGIADIEQQGSLEVGVVVDSFMHFNGPPGGYYRMKRRGADTTRQLLPWIENSQGSWGAFMAMTQLSVQQRLYLLLTDIGALLLRDPIRGQNDFPSLVELPTEEPSPFVWSAIVADFNGDDRDDVVLTRGTVLGTYDEDGDESDLLLIQTADGFVDRTGESGLLAHPPAFDDDSGRLHYSRAGVVTDFDRDGRLELLIMPFEGRPLLYEANAPAHCLAKVRSPYLPPQVALYGWSWIDHRGGLHALHVDGNMRLGQPEWVPLPARADGVVRAPSGARIPYACEPGDRIELEEPAWISASESQATLDLCAVGMQGSLIQTQRATGELTQRFADSAGMLTIGLDDQLVRVYVDGKFSVRCSADGGCER